MTNKKLKDNIADVCLACFKTLPKSGKPNQQEWTVLSCIVQEIDNNLTVVALGTGSKCIGRAKMSEGGDILNDCHAEAVCRRSFLKYIYSQMCFDSDILSFNKDTYTFSVDTGVTFHFFTTHVPCGDATIFSKQNVNDFGNIVDNCEELPRKKIKLDQDIFRTGAKCVEGSEEVDSKLPGHKFHVTGVVRTKPGRGDPTLSVSCSDKLAKWSHLGIQGSLLSILLDKPIYLSSFTIALNTPFCQKALERALYGRLKNVSLKYPYGQYRMVMSQSSRTFEFAKDDSKQPCPSSISYCPVTEKGVEVAVEGKRQGVTKKKLNTEAGRLKICKLELFKRFLKICEERNIVLKSDCDNFSLSYGCVKLLSKDYQHSWRELRQCFKTWTVKNKSLLDFLAK